MNSISQMLASSAYFGVFISLGAYLLMTAVQKKFKSPFLAPLLWTLIIIISFLMVMGISFEDYAQSASKISFFLTPATICYALPLYRQFNVLKKNFLAIILGVTAGCIGHFVVAAGTAIMLGLDKSIVCSLIPKSITTAIALGVTEEIGGIAGITVIGVCVAGLTGNMFFKIMYKALKIKNPVAQGLAMGTSSHALGTSSFDPKTEEVQLAMGSLAIVVAGILTAVLVPCIYPILESFMG